MKITIEVSDDAGQALTAWRALEATKLVGPEPMTDAISAAIVATLAGHLRPAKAQK